MEVFSIERIFSKSNKQSYENDISKLEAKAFINY
jgi:hypothetical protein